MSCISNEWSRIITKYSTISGETPTIPLSSDHTDGTWLPTDLYIGEFFLNSADSLLWIRTDEGIIPIGATGGSSSIIGDWVPISGGTFSGSIYAPTMSTATFSTNYMWVNLAEGIFSGTFSGDGSGLTGIVASWNGGAVSNPVYFTNTVDFNNTINLNSNIVGDLDLTGSVNISGGLSASVFYGDASGLYNFPTATYSDVFTIGATLSGTKIIFDRNDLATYDIDLAPVLGTYGVANISWDDTTDSLSLTMFSGDVITTTIDTFYDLIATNTITAPQFNGGAFYGDFYGNFLGTFSNDVYTTDANLIGTTAYFNRTDGASYSLDLSSISSGSNVGNGLEFISAGTIGLGGTFSKNTTLNGAGYDLTINDLDILTINPSEAELKAINGIQLKSADDFVSPTMESYINIGGSMVYTRAYDGVHEGIVSVNETTSVIASINGSSQSSIHITNYSNTMSSDGSLNSMLVRDDNNNKGLVYAADYTGNFTTHSLVTKGYVDSLTPTPPSLSDVLSVGNQTGPEWIDANNGYGVRSFYTYSTFTNTHKLYFDEDGVQLYSTNDIDGKLSRIKALNSGGIYLKGEAYSTFDFGDIAMISGFMGWEGLQYDADYSANFNDRSLVDKGYVDSSFTNAINITRANLYLGLTSSTLIKDATYYITDKKIWLKALDTNLLSSNGKRKMTILKQDAYDGIGTIGVWYDGLSPVIGDKVIWGGKLWSNLTGSVGTFDDPSTLNSTDWSLITSDSLYYDKVFDVEYDIVNNYVSTQQDDRFNIVIIPSGYFDDTNINITDWGNTYIYYNITGGIFNNTAGGIYNNNTYGSIEMNGNVGISIFNNKTYCIQNNKVGGINDNITDINGDGIINNIANGISGNNVVGISDNNIGFYNIGGNKSIGAIFNNTNTGDITSNVNSGSIYYNTNGGSISYNIVGGEISYNSNTGDILNNSNGGYIISNSNNGSIQGNNISGNIESNSNTDPSPYNGYILTNSGGGNIYMNSNTGGISFNLTQNGIHQNSNTGDISNNIAEQIHLNT